MAAPFEPLNSKERLREGLEGGAGAVLPLVLVHGFLALGGLFTENWEGLLIHGGLTGLAVLAALAVVKGRTVWPSLVILAWLGVEIFGGQAVFRLSDGRVGSQLVRRPFGHSRSPRLLPAPRGVRWAGPTTSGRDGDFGQLTAPEPRGRG